MNHYCMNIVPSKIQLKCSCENARLPIFAFQIEEANIRRMAQHGHKV